MPGPHWNDAHDIPKNPYAAAPAEPFVELHILTVDPEERTNRAADEAAALSKTQSILYSQRDAKWLLPLHRNPGA